MVSSRFSGLLSIILIPMLLHNSPANSSVKQEGEGQCAVGVRLMAPTSSSSSSLATVKTVCLGRADCKAVEENDVTYCVNSRGEKSPLGVERKKVYEINQHYMTAKEVKTTVRCVGSCPSTQDSPTLVLLETYNALSSIEITPNFIPADKTGQGTAIRLYICQCQ